MLPLLTVVFVVCAGLLIGRVQPALMEAFTSARRTPDAYLLPEPRQTVLLSLGYRAALADLLYATTRVQYGLHVSEGRRFEFAADYLDTVTTLDPTFREPYLYADTFITLQAGGAAGPKEFWEARRILERGMQQLPYDTKVWFTAGQYMAYLAAPHLQDEERKQWQLAGARALARACELASENKNIPYHCITAAGLLSRAGEQEALIQMLTRTLAVTDDEQIRAQALAYLRAKVGERVVESRQRRIEAFQRAWSEDLPFVKHEMLLILGPRVDTAACAGIASKVTPECATTWRDWMAARFGNEFEDALGASVE